MFVFSLLLTFSCEEPMPMGEVPKIPVPDPTPSATDAMQNRPPPNSEQAGDGAPPPTTTEDVPRNELGCGPTRFWAGTLADVNEVVSISGSIDFNSAQNGSYLIDVVATDKHRAVFGFECSKPGVFSVEVPADLGEVWLFAFIDTDGNGPSEEDPQGRTESFEVASDSIVDLTVPIRIGAVVEEAFELKPPSGGGGGSVEAPLDPTITAPAPEGVQGPSGPGEVIADQPLDIPQDNPPVGSVPENNPIIDPQSGEDGDVEE